MDRKTTQRRKQLAEELALTDGEYVRLLRVLQTHYMVAATTAQSRSIASAVAPSSRVSALSSPSFGVRRRSASSCPTVASSPSPPSVPNMVLSEDEARTLFGNLPAVIKCASELATALQGCIDKWTVDGCISSAFDTHFNRVFMDTYATYAGNCLRALVLAEKLLQPAEPGGTDHPFLAFVREKEEHPECAGVRLTSLLAQPVLRVGQYEDSLQDLLKVTNKQHTYYNLLNRCLQMVRNLNTQIGSHKRKIEDWERLCMMSQNLSSLDRKQLSLLREGRRLFGTFYVIDQSVDKLGECKLTILSDMFLLTKCRRFSDDETTTDESTSEDETKQRERVLGSSMLVTTHIAESSKQACDGADNGVIYRVVCVQPSPVIPFFEELTLLFMVPTEDLDEFRRVLALVDGEARQNKVAWLQELTTNLLRFVQSNAMSVHDWDRLMSGVRLQRSQTFNPGDSIVGDQEKLGLLYYLEEGEVQIFKGGSPIATLYPGSTIGELSFLDYPARRTSAAVVAAGTGPVRVVTMPFETLDSRLSPKPNSAIADIILSLRFLSYVVILIQLRRTQLLCRNAPSLSSSSGSGGGSAPSSPSPVRAPRYLPSSIVNTPSPLSSPKTPKRSSSRSSKRLSVNYEQVVTPPHQSPSPEPQDAHSMLFVPGMHSGSPRTRNTIERTRSMQSSCSPLVSVTSVPDQPNPVRLSASLTLPRRANSAKRRSAIFSSNPVIPSSGGSDDETVSAILEKLCIKDKALLSAVCKLAVEKKSYLGTLVVCKNHLCFYSKKKSTRIVIPSVGIVSSEIDDTRVTVKAQNETREFLFEKQAAAGDILLLIQSLSLKHQLANSTSSSSSSSSSGGGSGSGSTSKTKKPKAKKVIDVGSLAAKNEQDWLDIRKHHFTFATYNKGHVLIEFGKPQDRLFQVVSGSCSQYGAVDEEGENDLVRLNKGTIFGESSFLIGNRANERVVVRSETCEVAYIRRSKLLELCTTALAQQDRSLVTALVGFMSYLSKHIRRLFLEAEDRALERSGAEIIVEYVDEDDNPINSRDVVHDDDDDDDEDEEEEEVVYVVENDKGEMIQVSESELHLYQ